MRQNDANRVTSRRNPRCSSDFAFSPTCNSATLKGTPHPPIPQYPSGFFAILLVIVSPEVGIPQEPRSYILAGALPVDFQ
jgi:hypothetical protein